MPLEPIKRGRYYYAQGRVEYNGTPITEYYRKSTGSLTEAGAVDWIAVETAKRRRAYVVGPEAAFTFAEATMVYPASPKTAKKLIPIVKEIGDMPVESITEDVLKDLGRALKPDASTDTWWREIVTPARAVINKLHRTNRRFSAISVSSYTDEERNAQDERRGKLSRVEKQPSDRDWIERFCRAADVHNAALARFMFETGARIGQAVAITHAHLDPRKCQVQLKAQKGHKQTAIVVSPEMMEELQALPPKRTRHPKSGKLLEARVFGYVSSTSYNERWKRICAKAEIPYLSAHEAGRHGFFTELTVNIGVNPVDAAKAGRWKDPTVPMRIYAHSKADEAAIRGLFRTKLVQPSLQKTTNNLKEKEKSDDE